MTGTLLPQAGEFILHRGVVLSGPQAGHIPDRICHDLVLNIGFSALFLMAGNVRAPAILLHNRLIADTRRILSRVP